MMQFNLQKMFLPCCLFLLLSGCTIITQHYLNNHHDEALHITLVSFDPSELSLSYAPLIMRPKTDAYESFTVKLEHQQLDDRTLTFMIPAKSTVYLGYSTNGRRIFSSLELTSETIQLHIDDTNFDEHVEVFDTFFGDILYLFTID